MSEKIQTGGDPQYGGYSPERIKKKQKRLEEQLEQENLQSH